MAKKNKEYITISVEKDLGERIFEKGKFKENNTTLLERLLIGVIAPPSKKEAQNGSIDIGTSPTTRI
jgi:hypothetical protein